MSFSSNTRLTHKASIAVIASLWNQPDVIVDVKNLILGSPNNKTWRSIENNVISILHAIMLPKELKLMLNDLVQPMGMQICKWICLTQSTFQACSDFPESIIFIWTERGILDYSKTAKLIIDSSSDKILCYCLACIFCIEEIILKLWPCVGTFFYEKISRDLCAVGSNAVIYWTYYLNGATEKLMSLTEYCGVRNPYEFGLLFILDSKCVSSLSYFLKFIQPERKQRLVFLALQTVFHTTRPHDGNVVVFLYSHLTEYEIDQIVRENCYYVLSSLLEWPCQEFFMPIANSHWNSLSNLDYLNLLQDLAEFVSKYYVGDVYRTLFKQFWKSSPLPFKEYVKGKCLSGTFLSRLFLYENTEEIIQTIFHDCTHDERQHMIFYFEGMNLCDLLVKKQKWNYLKLLVKNCIQDQSTLQEFIKQYKKDKFFLCSEEVKLRGNILFEKMKEWY